MRRGARFLGERCWVPYHLPALGFGERTFKDERQMRRTARRQGVRLLDTWKLRAADDVAYPHPAAGWLYVRGLWLQTRHGLAYIGAAYARSI